jgi:hypothetical protein
MFMLQKPVPCVDFTVPACASADPPNAWLIPNEIVVAAATLTNLRRVKSTAPRSGNCVHA